MRITGSTAARIIALRTKVPLQSSAGILFFEPSAVGSCDSIFDTDADDAEATPRPQAVYPPENWQHCIY